MTFSGRYSMHRYRLVLIAFALTAAALLTITGGGAEAAVPGDAGLVAYVIPSAPNTARGNIAVVPPGGGDPVVIVATGTATDPSWSPDGRRLVYESLGETWIVDADGSNPTKHSSALTARGGFDWSPDGKWLIYASLSSIGLIEVRDQCPGEGAICHSARHIIDCELCAEPTYSPDGSKIAYTDSSYDLWVMDADGTNQRELVAGVGAYRPDFSPDGQWIVYDRHIGGDHDIWRVAVDGSADEQLTDAVPYEFGASYAPDGEAIVFSRYESETGTETQVWMMDADGTDERLFADRGEMPDWQPIVPAPAAFVEVGSAAVTHRWTPVTFAEDFDDPVVVAGPAGYSGHQPVTVRIRNVTPTGFEIRLQEWDYLDGRHVAERVDYLVVERGYHVLPGGVALLAGSVETNATKSPISIVFDPRFSQSPALFTSVVTDHGSEAVVSRVEDVSSVDFEVRLQEQESNWPWHTTERIDYVAWEFGIGDPADPMMWETATATPNHWFRMVSFAQAYESACVVADMNTMSGPDPAGLRRRDPSPTSIRLQVDEEQSADDEVWHRNETVSILVIDCE